MQRSQLTEEKQTNELAQTEYRFIKTRIKIWAAAITRCPSPPNQRCTAAKDGKLQGSHSKQISGVECVD
jgi:hypothetical protein